MIDCDTGYAGTFRTIEKSRGHVVLDETTPDREIDMIQTSAPKIDDQLCQLHQKAARPSGKRRWALLLRHARRPAKHVAPDKPSCNVHD